MPKIRWTKDLPMPSTLTVPAAATSVHFKTIISILGDKLD